MDSEKLSLEELINSFPKIEKNKQESKQEGKQPLVDNLSAAIWFLNNAEAIKEYLITLATQ
jgi:hypothetical protein